MVISQNEIPISDFFYRLDKNLPKQLGFYSGGERVPP